MIKATIRQGKPVITASTHTLDSMIRHPAS